MDRTLHDIDLPVKMVGDVDGAQCMIGGQGCCPEAECGPHRNAKTAISRIKAMPNPMPILLVGEILIGDEPLERC